jgi:hypothetical protein
MDAPHELQQDHQIPEGSASIFTKFTPDGAQNERKLFAKFYEGYP